MNIRNAFESVGELYVANLLLQRHIQTLTAQKQDLERQVAELKATAEMAVDPDLDPA